MILPKDILKQGSPILAKTATKLKTPISSEEKDVLNNMLKYIIVSQNEELANKFGLRPAVGIAAPQIGISKRMFAMHTVDGNNKLHSHMFINPKIIWKSKNCC